MIADTGDLFQLLEAGVQDLGKAPEPVQQRVGNGVGIPLGNRVEQQKLQRLNIRELIQPFLQESLLQPFPVALMDRSGCHIFAPFGI